MLLLFDNSVERFSHPPPPRATRAVLRQAQRKIEGVRATVVAVEEHAAAALAMSREARK